MQIKDRHYSSEAREAFFPREEVLGEPFFLVRGR